MAVYRIHKDSKGEYYWVLVSENNWKIVAMSSESYDSKQGAKNSIEWTQANATTKKVEDKTGE